MKFSINKIFELFMALLFMAWYLVLPIQALAFNQAQRFEIERRPLYDKTDCATTTITPNISTSSGIGVSKGQTYWLGDSLSVGLKSVGLDQKLNSEGFSAQINANGGRSINGAGIAGGGGPFQNAHEAVAADQEYIKNSKNIVVALGTNLENNFSASQAQLISEIKAINPSIKIVWVDISAVGNGNYSKQLAQDTNVAIYNNSSEQAYSILSSFKFIWGNDAFPKSLTSKSLPDPNNLLSSDGIHLTGDGYSKYANYIIEQFNSGVGSTTNPQTAASNGDCICSSKKITSSNLAGSDNREKAWIYLSGQGFTPPQVAGMIGNMVAESGLNPRRVEGTITPTGDSDNPGSGGYGIVQFTPGTKIIPFAKLRGKPPGDLGLQLDLLVSQLNGSPDVGSISEKPAGDALKSTTTVEEATTVFLRRYERAGVERLDVRLDAANQAMVDFGGGSTPTPTTTNTSTTTNNPLCPDDITSTSTIDTSLPEGTKEELIEKIKATNNVGNTNLLSTSMKRSILAITFRLAEKYKFVIGSTIRDKSGPHSNGSAIDLGNINNTGKPGGEDYEGVNQEGKDFVTDAANLLFGASYMGVPNQTYLDIAVPIMQPKGGSNLIETRANNLADGAHFHLNVSADTE